MRSMWIATPFTSFLALSPHVALWGVRECEVCDCPPGAGGRGRGVRKLVARWLQFSGRPEMIKRASEVGLLSTD